MVESVTKRRPGYPHSSKSSSAKEENPQAPQPFGSSIRDSAAVQKGKRSRGTLDKDRQVEIPTAPGPRLPGKCPL